MTLHGRLILECEVRIQQLTPTQSGNILFVCLFLYIYIAISLLKTLTIAFICKNIGYFRPIRLTENKTNRKSANYTHNREYELLCQFASGSCQAIKSITSDKVNVANRLNKNRRKTIFNWAAKGLFFLKEGGGYTHSGYHKTLSATIACDRTSCETDPFERLS